MVDCWKIWLTFCHEFRRALFCSSYCSSSTPQSFFFILENKLIGNDDDATLLSVVSSPGVMCRVAAAESLNWTVDDPIFALLH